MTQTKITAGMTGLNCGTSGSALTWKGGEVWMRLIDADDLAAKIMMEAPDFMDGGSSITKAFILAMIKTRSVTPTIDAVPVVRCKDCEKRNNIEKCPVYRAIAHITMNVEMPDNINPTNNSNWFCASGVAKEGDDHEKTVAGRE